VNLSQLNQNVDHLFYLIGLSFHCLLVKFVYMCMCMDICMPVHLIPWYPPFYDAIFLVYLSKKKKKI